MVSVFEIKIEMDFWLERDCMPTSIAMSSTNSKLYNSLSRIQSQIQAQWECKALLEKTLLMFLFILWSALLLTLIVFVLPFLFSSLVFAIVFAIVFALLPVFWLLWDSGEINETMDLPSFVEIMNKKYQEIVNGKIDVGNQTEWKDADISLDRNGDTNCTHQYHTRSRSRELNW